VSATCPAGHLSTSDDYCDVCGTPIEATAAASGGTAVPAAAAPTGGPVHVHLSEQRAENEQCLAVHGCTPTELLRRHGVLRPGSAQRTDR